MPDCGDVASASAAMKERVAFVMCALDAYQQTATWFTCLQGLLVCGLHPLHLDIVLKRRGVRRSSDDDPQTAIMVRNPGRSLTGSQELMSDAWAARLREYCGRGGLVAGDAEASTIPAINLVARRDKLVCTTPLGSFHPHEGNVPEGAQLCQRRK
jgi:hypothetical protein